MKELIEELTGKGQYREAAEKFASLTGTALEVDFIRNGLYFPEDKEKRDIYVITLTRGKRSYSFEFGQSIYRSGKFIVLRTAEVWDSEHRKNVIVKKGEHVHTAKRPRDFKLSEVYAKNKNFSAPDVYDVFTSIEKRNPGMFEDFCADNGYDTDSRKAFSTYEKVCAMYKEVCALYSNEELEAMQEIN